MRFFVFLIDQEGRTCTDVVRRHYESLPRSRGLRFQWLSLPNAALLTAWDDPMGVPQVVGSGDWVAVGTVRLDNRLDLARWSGCGLCLSDLELVLHTVSRHGTKHIPQFYGDFAFVVWNSTARTAVAACDIFALKKLYYTDRNGVIAFASRAEALATDERYDVQYLAELVAGCKPSRGLTAYAGVRAVAAGTLAIIERGKVAAQQYWRPEDFEPDRKWNRSGQETAVSTCRELLIDALQLRLCGTGGTWAQLSGGLDSSAVVSLAQWLTERGMIEHGISGTVSFVDRQGTETDERQYSDAVVQRWHIRNEVIVDPPFWYDDGCPLPSTDLPTFFLPFYPRERRLCAIVRAAGGRVLLTGQGGDELFTGSMLFFADWLAKGQVWPAAREMARRAAIGRVSFWELAYRNAFVPLLPRALQLRLAKDQGQMPAWVSEAMARHYDLQARSAVLATYAGPIGHKYEHAARANVMVFTDAPEYGLIADTLDVRHPFLYRPLVEFALRLPAELCVQPYARKWIVREAMRDILPDTVRTRVGKGAALGLYAQSLTTQRALLEPLVRDPILADMGVVDAAKLWSAFNAAPHQPSGREQSHAAVHFTLCIEAWLQIRSGRWPCGSQLRSSRSSSTVVQ